MKVASNGKYPRHYINNKLWFLDSSLVRWYMRKFKHKGAQVSFIPFDHQTKDEHINLILDITYMTPLEARENFKHSFTIGPATYKQHPIIDPIDFTNATKHYKYQGKSPAELDPAGWAFLRFNPSLDFRNFLNQLKKGKK